MTARWFLWLVACVGIGCDPPEVPPSVPVPQPEAGPSLEPMWAGCEDYVDAKCLMLDAPAGPTLRFWADVRPVVPLEVAADGVILQGRLESVDGGTRVTVSVPARTRALTVEGAGVRGRLEIVWHARSTALAAAMEAFDDGNTGVACATLVDIGAQDSPFDRVQSLRYADACRSASYEVSVARYSDAADLAETYGFEKSFAQAGASALYTCAELLGDLDCGARWADRLAGLRAPEVRAWVEYSRGLIEVKRGKLSVALDAFAKAERLAERLGQVTEYEAAFEQRIGVLAELGRTSDARDAAMHHYSRAQNHADPCERARLIHNAAWPLQLLAESGSIDDFPLDWLLEEVAIYESGACGNRRGQLLARIDTASALLHDGDVEGARHWLTTIQVEDQRESIGDLVQEIDYLAIATALATNDWSLAPIPLLGRAEASGDARLAWRTRVQNARVLERFGLGDAALDQWHAAERILDADLSTVAVGQGRETFISARGSSAVGLVEALLARDASEEALCRVRLARGRAMRAADRRRNARGRSQLAQFDAFVKLHAELDDEARSDWSLSAEELSDRRVRRDVRRREALESFAIQGDEHVGAGLGCEFLTKRGSGELLLALLPTDAGTIVLAGGPRGTAAYRFSAVPPGDASRRAWADGVVDRLSSELVGVSRVRVLPVGVAWEVPMHAARIAGVPIVENVSVAYGLDMLTNPPRPERPRRALVLADPSEDLPGAVEERDVVALELGRAGWDVDVLRGDEMSRTAVMAKLGEVDLFHYAGHGERRGEDGWDAAMLLALGTTMEPADILSAAVVPRLVVLAGCETGAIHGALVDGGMGLGQAFLLAGADDVVVSDRPVLDGDALAFTRALYGDAGALLLDPAAAVARAYRASRPAGSRSDAWSGFRLLVR